MKRISGAINVVYYISFPLTFLGFILPVYASSLGSSPIEIGMLYSVFSLCSVLIRPQVGKWIDNRGRRSGLLTGMLFYTLSIGLYLAAQNYVYILLARIVQSIGSSFLWVSLDTMVSDVSSGENRGRNFGVVEQFSNRGTYLGSLIGFTILFNKNFEDPFKNIFGIYLVISIYALIKGMKIVNETLNPSEEKIYEVPIRNREFIKYIAVMGILAAISSMTAPVFLVYLRETITKDLALTSFLFVPGALLSLFLPARMGKFSDRAGRKVMLLSGMLISAVFTMLIPAVKGYYLFMALYTALSAAGLIGSPAQSALVAEITGGNHRGRAYGLYQFATGIGGTLGPMLGTLVYQYIGKGIIFYIQGAALIAGAVVIWLVIKDRKTSEFRIVKSEI